MFILSLFMKVKSMQRSGTEAIRTQIHSSKPKREITNIINSQNTKRTYGQPGGQLFPKRWPLRNQNRTKNNTNTRKVKRHRNFEVIWGHYIIVFCFSSWWRIKCIRNLVVSFDGFISSYLGLGGGGIGQGTLGLGACP